MPVALAAVWPGLRRRQAIGRAARAVLQGTIGTDGNRLPAVGMTNLEARVHQSVLLIPYIHRDIEGDIRAFLRSRRPVLLIGSSLVGKTKTAAQVIAEEFSSWPVAIPDSKSALAEIEAQDVRLQDSVIWLDDIDRLIGPGGVTDGALRRLADARNVIIGTIRARAYDQLQPSDQLRPPEWDVLSVFGHVFISRDLTQQEQDRLACAIDDPDVQDRIHVVGLGEYVGAARQVAEALKLGAAGADPLGYALILGAADWRRCGITRPVPDSMLAPLAKSHLDQRSRARLADQDDFKAGLAWATRDINPNVALLQRTATNSYSIYDYAVDLISAQGKPIPESSWTMIIANADPPELVSLGYTAEVTYDLHEIAAQAWRKAADSGHANMVPIATVNLGQLLENQGELEGAKNAYQKAIESGHATAAPRAAVNLGALLQELGDLEGAKAAFQSAVESGHATAAPRAAVSLGLLLRGEGDMQGAKAAFQRAIDSGHADLAPRAEFNLGLLLESQGELEGAEDAYQKVIDSVHADLAPRAAVGLGLVLRRQGDLEGAKAGLQMAIDSGHADTAPMAEFSLGLLLQELGDLEGAKAAFQKAIDSGHVDMAPDAELNLGRLLRQQGDVQGAKAAFQRAIDSGHPDVAPWAKVLLGRLLRSDEEGSGKQDSTQHPEASR
jgi:tetratricopeptide (TPR) repeat protein